MTVIHTCNLSLPKLDKIRLFDVDNHPNGLIIKIDNTRVAYNMEYALYNQRTKVESIL